MNVLKRQTREDPQSALFEIGDSWEDLWWGMPSYEMGDARPVYRITVNLFTLEDLIEFGKRIGQRVTPNTDTVTFPQEQIDKPSDWVYTDEA
jgi:hypothetical protein